MAQQHAGRDGEDHAARQLSVRQRKIIKTYLERRWGGGGEDPSKAELVEALSELSIPDAEHPDCWLTDENEWVISAHESGKVVLENAETGEGPWHMKNVNHETILDMWLKLQGGNLKAIKDMPWIEGYE
jgi:hypothetical protein